ncbi:M protein trans-acting positive regulator PRD domain-containing protein, partial [Streptococcus pneumoniae]|uniref:M protein trans-acting positive regulator PRD domain-containing protein n=1 Tax=Streptococcus pneumoniae TaxID=1313 RepID=UPI000A4EE12F
KEYYPLLKSIPNFQETLAYFSKHFGLEMTPDTIAQIFISFLQNDIFLDPQEFFNSLEDNSQARYSYQLLSQILERLSNTILTHAENLSTQLLENRPPIKVLIISNFDHAISLTFVDMLSYYCNNRFTFDIWDELKTSPEILNQTDYDIIVSNFYIP